MKKIILALMVMTSIFNAQIANASTSGSRGTSTINVTTKSDWGKPGQESITLSNRVVRIAYRSLTNKELIKKIYPKYIIDVKSTDGRHRYTKSMGSSNIKLSLQRNKRYYITVKYDDNGTWIKYSNLRKARMLDNPYWCVKNTVKSECY